MHDIIRFHVPCKLEYTKLVEDFTSIITSYLNPESTTEFAQKLRAVMNEVFINIVKHSKTSELNEVIRFQFELGTKFFSISIYDYGPGFKADEKMPPYPKKVIGNKYSLSTVIDGEVNYTIVDPHSISFSFEEKQDVDLDDLVRIDEVQESGMGLSIVTKLMDSVTYTYLGGGKYDWKLVKELS